jgi:hypothetical protein
MDAETAAIRFGKYGSVDDNGSWFWEVGHR